MWTIYLLKKRVSTIYSTSPTSGAYDAGKTIEMEENKNHLLIPKNF